MIPIRADEPRSPWQSKAVVALVAGLAAIIVALIQFVIGPCFMKDDGNKTNTDSETVTATPTTEASTDTNSTTTDALPTNPPPPPSKIGSFTVYVTPVEDEQGNRGVAEVYVLSNEYAWQCRSSEIIRLGGAVEDIASHLQAPPMQERFHKQQALVAVGAASYEGADQGTEERRAMDRAVKLSSWLRNNISGDLPPLWTLNLGQFSSKGRSMTRCSESSEFERPVVILGVTTESPNFSVPAVLSKAFAEPEFPLKREDYSRFDPQRRS